MPYRLHQSTLMHLHRGSRTLEVHLGLQCLRCMKFSHNSNSNNSSNSNNNNNNNNNSPVATIFFSHCNSHGSSTRVVRGPALERM